MLLLDVASAVFKLSSAQFVCELHVPRMEAVQYKRALQGWIAVSLNDETEIPLLVRMCL